MNGQTSIISKVFFVWTRPEPGVGVNGRDNFIRNFRSVLKDQIDVADFHLEGRVYGLHSFYKLSAIIYTVIQALLSGRSIQDVLFDSKFQTSVLLDRISVESPKVIYFDTVRCAAAIRAIERYGYRGRILIDFDDLMSLRYARYSSHVSKHGLQLGYLKKVLGSRLSLLLDSLPIGAWIMRREGVKLKILEIEMSKLADVIILASDFEAETFKHDVNDLSVSVEVIPQLFLSTMTINSPCEPYRFIFVGSDHQLQNAIVIDYLCRMWEVYAPRVPLFIYGRQRRSLVIPNNVHMAGYEPSFQNIYTKNSIVIAPALLAGGVKTKLIEALSFGVPVITNRLGIEGLAHDLWNTGIALEDDEILQVLLYPEQYIDQVVNNSRSAQRILHDICGAAPYKQKVLNIFEGDQR